MTSFLLWIGAYNAVGALFVLALLNEKFAERVLGKWIQILAMPYSHGANGPLWIWWASSSNLAVGVIMMLASRWPLEVQQGITAVAVGLYIMMGIVAAFGMRSPRYSAKGILGTLVLWVAQIAWGSVGLAQSL